LHDGCEQQATNGEADAERGRPYPALAKSLPMTTVTP
jgi:hypothetical protein